jgi:hypothetical protein
MPLAKKMLTAKCKRFQAKLSIFGHIEGLGVRSIILQ